MMPTSDDVREPIQGRAVAGHAQGRLELFYTCMVDNRAIVMYGPFPVGKDGKFGGMADGHVFGLCIPVVALGGHDRSEENTSELQSLMRISYAVFCLKQKKHKKQQ